MQDLDVPARKYRLVITGLIIDQPLTLEEWEDLGAKLSHMRNANTWQIADWLNYSGKGEWGESYTQGMNATGLDYSYLAHLARVGRAFPHEDRIPGIPISYYMALLSLPEEERLPMLERVESEDLNRDQLRASVKKRLEELGAPERALPRATSWRGFVREARHSDDGRVMVVIEFEHGADLARGDAVEVRVK